MNAQESWEGKERRKVNGVKEEKRERKELKGEKSRELGRKREKEKYQKDRAPRR